MDAVLCCRSVNLRMDERKANIPHTSGANKKSISVFRSILRIAEQP